MKIPVRLNQNTDRKKTPMWSAEIYTWVGTIHGSYSSTPIAIVVHPDGTAFHSYLDNIVVDMISWKREGAPS